MPYVNILPVRDASKTVTVYPLVSLPPQRALQNNQAMNRYHCKVNFILKITVLCFDVDFPAHVQDIPLLHDLYLLVLERTLSTNAVFAGGQVRCKWDDSL